MVIELSLKTVILLHVLFILGAGMFVSGFFVKAKYVGLSLTLIILGLLIAACSVFSRDYYFRCPNCGRSMFKKQSYKNRFRGIPLPNCPDCHWHTNVVIKK